jgi:hypothetical protein
MIIDKRNEFADAVALSTAATGRQLVGDVIDLGGADEIGYGDTPYLVISVDTAVTSAGSATISFELVSDAQAAIAVDGSATVHASTAHIGKASLIAGYNALVVKLPIFPAAERYLGIIANVQVAALTAGKVNAFLVADPSAWKAYADAIN